MCQLLLVQEVPDLPWKRAHLLKMKENLGESRACWALVSWCQLEGKAPQGASCFVASEWNGMLLSTCNQHATLTLPTHTHTHTHTNFLCYPSFTFSGSGSPPPGGLRNGGSSTEKSRPDISPSPFSVNVVQLWAEADPCQRE